MHTLPQFLFESGLVFLETNVSSVTTLHETVFFLDRLIKILHTTNIFYCSLILVQGWHSSVRADYSGDSHFGMCKNHQTFF